MKLNRLISASNLDAFSGRVCISERNLTNLVQNINERKVLTISNNHFLFRVDGSWLVIELRTYVSAYLGYIGWMNSQNSVDIHIQTRTQYLPLTYPLTSVGLMFISWLVFVLTVNLKSSILNILWHNEYIEGIYTGFTENNKDYSNLN